MGAHIYVQFFPIRQQHPTRINIEISGKRGFFNNGSSGQITCAMTGHKLEAQGEEQ